MMTLENTRVKQKRSPAKVNESTTRQRSFYLSDEAIEQLKKHTEESNSPSINHALEALLRNLKQ
jgi:hypothetical protein